MYFSVDELYNEYIDTMVIKRDIDEYDNRVYFLAKIPYIIRGGCAGIGDTREEAIEDLKENFRGWLEIHEDVGEHPPLAPLDKENMRKN